MLKIMGIVLIVYSVISITILIILRKDAIKFWDTQVEKFKNVIKQGKSIIPSLSEGAKVIRKSGSHVTDLVEHLKRDIIPSLKKTIETLDDVTKTINNLPEEIKNFVTKASTSIKNSIAAVTKTMDYLTKKTIPNTTNTLIELSRDLYQPPFLLTSEALNLLEQDDQVPHEVIVKLNSCVENPFETENDFRKKLTDVLTTDELNLYAGKVILRSENPLYDEGMVVTLEEALQAMHDIGSETLPSVANIIIKAKNTVAALVVLADTTVLSLVPLAASIRAISDSFLTVFGNLGGDIKIIKGSLGNLTLPPIDIKWGLKIPKGDFIKYNKRVAGVKISFNVPDDDIEKKVIDIDVGDWVNTPLPPSDITLFNGHDIVEGFQNVREKADNLVKVSMTPTSSFDIRDNLQQAGDKLKATANKILELAEDKKRLPKQIEKLKKQASNLANQANEIEEAAIEIDKMIDTLEKQVNDILNTIQDFADSSVITIEKTSNKLKELADQLRTLSLDEELEDLKKLAEDLTEFANSIDKGDPIGSKGKSDLVQQLANIFNAVCESIPARKNILRLFNGVFGFLIVIHIAFLATGIILVRSI